METPVYSLGLKIDLDEEEIAESIYRAIHTDVEKEGISDVSVTLEIMGATLLFKVSSPSYAKFRGMIITFLRLVMVSRDLIGFCGTLIKKESG